MQKIPTIFERDWDGDRSLVTRQPTPGCEWVFAGEGVATRKYDGTCCMVRDGKLYKRHEVRRGKNDPEGFELVEDAMAGKRIGWVPVGDGPEDRWHRDAFSSLCISTMQTDPAATAPPNGTYELIGPKVQANPEKSLTHVLVRHADAEEMGGIVLTFDGIREVLGIHNIEGIVWHHPDGRMAKIKARDLGITRGA